MHDFLRAPGIDFRFEVIDIRTLDGAALRESERLSDNLLALLMRSDDTPRAVRRIVAHISRLDVVKRKAAITRFLITCGMRKMTDVAVEEITKMPVTMNIVKEDPFLAKLAREGREEGREEGRDLGKRDLLRLMITKKFGALPAWVEERLSAYSSPQIDDVAERIIDDGSSLDELFNVK